MTTHTTSLIKKLIRLGWGPHKALWIKGVIAMTLSSGATAALAYGVKPAFDHIFASPSWEKIFVAIPLIIVLFILKGSATYGETVWLGVAAQRVISGLQEKLACASLRAPIEAVEGRASAGWISVMIQDSPALKRFIETGATTMVRDSLTILGLGGVMLYQDPILSAIVWLGMPLGFYPVWRLRRRIRTLGENLYNGGESLQTHMQGWIENLRVIKAYGEEVRMQHRIQEKIKQLRTFSERSLRLKSIVHPFMEGFGGIGVAVIMLYGGWALTSHHATTGILMSFLTALLLVYAPLKRLMNLNAQWQEGAVAAQRIFQALAALPQEPVEKGAHFHFKTGTILFKNVSFTYPGSDLPSLDNVNLSLPGQKRIALVGASGAGKSTLMALLLGFYSPQKGEIQIDGQDLTGLSLKSWRTQIAYVGQEGGLWDGTVEEMIMLGSPGATSEQCHQAALKAHAHDFIMNLPQGYQTYIGERGLRLSGGQRQRLLLARAFLRSPSFIMLDEATAALDSLTEHYIHQALQDLSQGRTTIIIAHRLSTVMDADLVVVMDQGQVAEQGTHDQLMEQGGIYARLVIPQLEQVMA